MRSVCLLSRIASAYGWSNFPVALAMPTGSDDAFSAGDLLMVTVLRRLSGSGMLEKYPNLSAYLARGEARPAFKRAFDAQLAVFTGKPSTG
jgi:glutathione S-transferase